MTRISCTDCGCALSVILILNANGRVLMKPHNVARVSDAGLLPDQTQPFLDSRQILAMRRLRTLIAIMFETRPSGTIQVSAKSTQKFKHRIRELTGRSRGISMPHRLSQLRSDVRGWTGYFGLASQLKLFDRLDQWIRRRIRMCYWKQWLRPKRRREMLLQLGVPRRQAIRHARSRKGAWHMARYSIEIWPLPAASA